MKILELNGHKYSKDSFESYKFRAQVKIIVHGEDHQHLLDIYTTDDNKESVEDVLLDRKADNVMSLRITYWTTRESDDASGEMINEWLNKK
jgi:hypothetical protein